MTSNRIILAILAILLLSIILLSSGRLRNIFRRTSNTTAPEVMNAQVTVTPSPVESQSQNTGDENAFNGSEIPNTGPMLATYLILGGGLLGGIMINKFRG